MIETLRTRSPKEASQAAAEEARGPERRLAIECRGLCKSFGSRPVLRGVDLEVEEGQRLVVFGPNGAGKTTLIKVLGTLASATAGQARLAGFDLRREASAVRRRIGVVSHRTYLYDDLTGYENLRFYGKMYGLADLDRRITEVADYVGLGHRLGDRVRTLSRGMQQRLSIARAVLHDPAVLLLDEPETGLDQWAASRLPRLLEAMGDRRRTVLMTTHNLEVGLHTADRVAILDRGRVVFQAPRGDLDAEGLREVYQGLAAGGRGSP